MRLRCTIVLPNDAPDLGRKSVEVRVEDATQADGPAVVLARRRIPSADLTRTQRRLGPIELDVELPEPRRNYIVRTRLLEEDDLATGDLTSTQSHPLPANATSHHVEIPVRVVE
jgi:hypothetical protein